MLYIVLCARGIPCRASRVFGLRCHRVDLKQKQNISGGHRAALGGGRDALLRLKQRAAVRRSVSTLSIDAPEARDGLSIMCARSVAFALP
jgi:hypothetical protein